MNQINYISCTLHRILQLHSFFVFMIHIVFFKIYPPLLYSNNVRQCLHRVGLLLNTAGPSVAWLSTSLAALTQSLESVEK